MATTTEPHPPSERASAWLYAALPVAVPAAIALLISILASFAGEPLALQLRDWEVLIVAVVIVLSSLAAIALYTGPSRAPARVAALLMTVFFAVLDFGLMLAVGLGTCGDSAPPRVATFCNDGGVGDWQLGLLSVFPILLAGYLLRRGHRHNWPFALAILLAGGVLGVLVSLVP